RQGGTAQVLAKFVEEGGNGTVIDRIGSGGIAMVINTPNATSHAARIRADGYEIRTAAIAEGIGCITTVAGLAAAVPGIEAQLAVSVWGRSLQAWSGLWEPIPSLSVPPAIAQEP